MASRNTWAQYVVDSGGSPVTGLTPTFASYKKSTNGGAYANVTAPNVSELGAGWYEADPALAAGEAVNGAAYVFSF